MHDLIRFDLSGPDGDDDVLLQIGDGPIQRVRGPVTIGRCVPPHDTAFAVTVDPKEEARHGRYELIGGRVHRILAPHEVTAFVEEHCIPYAWRYPRR